MGKFEDLTSRRFGRLVVISRAPNRGKIVYWKCRCDCGKLVETQGCALKAAHAKSCGCWQRDYRKGISPANRTHGQRYADGGRPSREYRAWCNMIQRCENPGNMNYEDYGGRGINISRDMRSFDGFLEILGRCPSDFTLDRIDVNGNYERGNVRWIAQADQKRNTRKNRFISYRGRTMTISEWAREAGMTPAKLTKRIRRGWPIERALGYV